MWAYLVGVQELKCEQWFAAVLQPNFSQDQIDKMFVVLKKMPHQGICSLYFRNSIAGAETFTHWLSMTQRNVLTCTRHNHEYPGDHCCIIIIIYFPQIHGLYHKHNRIKQEHKDG